MNSKDERISAAADAMQKMDSYKAQLRSPVLQKAADEVYLALRDLRDIQYLFDSGEKELQRFYDRYLPYYLSIFSQFLSLQDSANYEAIKTNEVQLEDTMKRMTSLIRGLIRTLPQDEIDEANARAKAEEAGRKLEEERNNMIK